VEAGYASKAVALCQDTDYQVGPCLGRADLWCTAWTGGSPRSSRGFSPLPGMRQRRRLLYPASAPGARCRVPAAGGAGALPGRGPRAAAAAGGADSAAGRRGGAGALAARPGGGPRAAIGCMISCRRHATGSARAALHSRGPAPAPHAGPGSGAHRAGGAGKVGGARAARCGATPPHPAPHAADGAGRPGAARAGSAVPCHHGRGGWVLAPFDRRAPAVWCLRDEEHAASSRPTHGTVSRKHAPCLPPPLLGPRLPWPRRRGPVLLLLPPPRGAP
jgi:hypothetical protein